MEDTLEVTSNIYGTEIYDLSQIQLSDDRGSSFTPSNAETRGPAPLTGWIYTSGVSGNANVSNKTFATTVNILLAMLTTKFSGSASAGFFTELSDIASYMVEYRIPVGYFKGSLYTKYFQNNDGSYYSWNKAFERIEYTYYENSSCTKRIGNGVVESTQLGYTR